MTAVSESMPRSHAKPAVIERLTPLRALALAHAVWVLVLIITPVSPRWPTEWLPLGLLALSILALVLGIAMPHLLGIKVRDARTGTENLKTIFLICLVLGIIGVSCRLIDLLFVRGVTLSFDLTENRRASGEGGASALSSLAAFLGPFAFASLALSCAAVRVGSQRTISKLALFFGLAGMLLPIIFGSRSGILLAAGQLGCLAVLLLPRITPRMILFGAAAGLVMVVVFALLFVLRFEQFGMDYKVAARYSAYTLVTPLQDEYLAIIDSADAALGIMLAAYASLLQYYLHGLFEFFFLVELKSSNFSMGDYQFFFFSKLIGVITGGTQPTAVYLEYLENPRAGVFQALYGPAYIDFGYFSFVFMMALGMVAELARLRVRAGDMTLLPFYIYLLVTFLLAPCVSGVIMNAGSITLFSYLSLFLLSMFLRGFWGIR